MGSHFVQYQTHKIETSVQPDSHHTILAEEELHEGGLPTSLS